MSDSYIGNYGMLIKTTDPTIDFILTAKGFLQSWGNTLIDNIDKQKSILLPIYLDSSIKLIYTFDILIYSKEWRAYQYKTLSATSQKSTENGISHSHTASSTKTTKTVNFETPNEGNPYTSCSTHGDQTKSHKHSWIDNKGISSHAHTGAGSVYSNDADSAHAHGSDTHIHPFADDIEFFDNTSKVTGNFNVLLNTVNIVTGSLTTNDTYIYNFTNSNLEEFQFNNINNLEIELPSTNDSKGSLQVTYFIQAFMTNV
jgi:hypothetical protein